MQKIGDALVSIHAPAIRRDRLAANAYSSRSGFQSTRLRLGATRAESRVADYPIVSIHAPAIRRDHTGHPYLALEKSFNPRACD